MLDYGIKFCGGCNPRYNRKEIYNQLLNCNSNYTFGLIDDNKYCSNLIVLGGCPNCCASIDNIFVINKTYKIYAEQTAKELILELSNI